MIYAVFRTFLMFHPEFMPQRPIEQYFSKSYGSPHPKILAAVVPSIC